MKLLLGSVWRNNSLTARARLLGEVGSLMTGSLGLTTSAVLLAGATVLAGSVQGRAETTRRTVEVSVGQSAVVQFKENPSTGYGWRLSQAESSNLAVAAISDAGFSVGGAAAAPLVGAPGVQRFRIEGRLPGEARAVFVYSRPWERAAPAERQIVMINVR